MGEGTDVCLAWVLGVKGFLHRHLITMRPTLAKMALSEWSTIEKGYAVEGTFKDIICRCSDFGNCLNFKGKGVVEGNKGVVVSPLSFHLVLSLLAAGSEGPTRRQIVNYYEAGSVQRLNATASMLSNVLLTDRDPAVGPRMRCSTALWHHHSLTLNHSFQHVLRSDYKASLNPLDFHGQGPQVRRQINWWAEHETSRLVQDLIHQRALTNSVKLVFANALYFKGAWDKTDTKPPYTFEDIQRGTIVDAPFMTAEFVDICCRKYSQHKFARSSEDKRYMNATCKNFGSDETTMKGEDKILKCNVSSAVEASNKIRRQGITLPFSRGGLTEMLSCFEDNRELYVCNIFQKSSMEINEQGTEAATATAVIVTSGLPVLPETDIVEEYYVEPPNITEVQLSAEQVI